MKRLTSVVVAAVVTAGVLGGCSRGSSDPAPGEARLVSRSGVVQVSADGRSWRDAHEGTLRRGQRVRVRSGGSAVLALTSGARAELRGGSQVLVGRPLHLVAGDLLVRAGDDRVAVDATSAVASVTSGGDARLSRGLALDTAVYDGAVDLRSGSRSFRVAALRQVSVPGVGLLPDAGTSAPPLKYRASDRWDREFLGDWIALGDDLEARSNGLSGQIGADQGRTAGFYRLLLPELDSQPEFTQTLVDAQESVPPGERLVGAVIALAGTRRASFAQRWTSAFAFRAEGAEWGLVALDQRVRDRPALVTQMDAALSRVVTRPEVAAAASVTPSGSTSGDTSRGGVGATSPPATDASGAGGGTTSPSTSPTTSPSSPPTTQPLVPVLPLPTLPPPSGNQSQPSSPPTTQPPSSSGDTIGQLTDTLVDTVGGLLGGLSPPSP
jgi:hypothetical protein